MSSLAHKERQRARRLALELEEAMAQGDIERLHELAPCTCCCDEHTSPGCAARAWNGCRGGSGGDSDEYASWLRHYQVHHGLTQEEFDTGEIDPLRQIALDARNAAPRCHDCGVPVFDDGYGLVDPDLVTQERT